MHAVVHILGNESVIWSGSSHIVGEKLIRNVALIMIITALIIMKAQKGSLLDFLVD